MQPHRNGFCKVKLAYDDGNRAPAYRIAEYDEARGRARIQWYRGLACQRQRSRCLIRKTPDGVCLDSDDVRFAQNDIRPRIGC